MLLGDLGGVWGRVIPLVAQNWCWSFLMDIVVIMWICLWLLVWEEYGLLGLRFDGICVINLNEASELVHHRKAQLFENANLIAHAKFVNFGVFRPFVTA